MVAGCIAEEVSLQRTFVKRRKVTHPCQANASLNSTGTDRIKPLAEALHTQLLNKFQVSYCDFHHTKWVKSTESQSSFNLNDHLLLIFYLTFSHFYELLFLGLCAWHRAYPTFEDDYRHTDPTSELWGNLNDNQRWKSDYYCSNEHT